MKLVIFMAAVLMGTYFLLGASFFLGFEHVFQNHFDAINTILK